MQYSLAALALAALAVAKPMPQGITSAIAPASSPPADCSPNYSGSFEIEIVELASSKRGLHARDDSALTVTLSNGVLTDNQGRTGYIADNYQFQFDAPAQTGAIYTAGWSVCSNGSLALGDSAVFYECLSGTFYNLYDEDVAAQCNPIFIEALGTGASPAPAADVVGASSLIPPAVTTSAAAATAPSSGNGPVTQISDGQIQGPTSKASPPAPTTPAAATTPAAPPAPTTTVAPPAPPPTTPRPSGRPITQISDGQPQAPTGGPIVNGTTPRPTTPITPSVNAGVTLDAVRGGLFGLAALVLAVALL